MRIELYVLFCAFMYIHVTYIHVSCIRVETTLLSHSILFFIVIGHFLIYVIIRRGFKHVYYH